MIRGGPAVGLRWAQAVGLTPHFQVFARARLVRGVPAAGWLVLLRHLSGRQLALVCQARWRHRRDRVGQVRQVGRRSFEYVYA